MHKIPVLILGWLVIAVSGGISPQVSSLRTTQTFSNPVVDVNTPDPGVLYVESEQLYYVVTTSGNDKDVFPIRSSKDLVSWDLVGHVYPNGEGSPAWAKQDWWAPEIHQVGEKYYVYYCVLDDTDTRVIGVASSSNPAGPYVDSGVPLVREGGSPGFIDVHLYKHATDKLFLVYKNDGNARGLKDNIFIAELESNGMKVKEGSSPTPVLSNDQEWESTCVEAPWLMLRDGYYYLFYSANIFDARRPDGMGMYSVGVARSKELFGPYEKHPGPILQSGSPGEEFSGPGHCSVVTGPSGALVMVYHSYEADKLGTGPRVMLIDRVTFSQDGWPVIGKNGIPTSSRQPIP